jgi:hypothetical protein
MSFMRLGVKRKIVILQCLLVALLEFSNMETLEASDFFFGSDTLYYTLVINIAPDNFVIPLVGVLNFSSSTPFGIHIGAINFNEREFGGFQVGGINFTEEAVRGFVIGGVNITPDSFQGVQIGGINWSGEDMYGIEIGFINRSDVLHGVQIGLVNYCDSIEEGLPFGIINIVRSGGNHAADFFYSDIAPFNVKLHIGVDSYYSFTTFSIDPFISGLFFFGLGMGWHIDLGAGFAFTPEVSGHIGIMLDPPDNAEMLYGGLEIMLDNMRYLISVAPLMTFNFFDYFGIIAGPSVTYVGRLTTNKPTRFIGIGINDDCRFAIGWRLGVRISW